MRNDPTPPDPFGRPDLYTMFLHGAMLADDGLIDLVTAAVRCDARELRRDGSYRRRFSTQPTIPDIEERIAAGLAGAAAAFSQASERYIASSGP